MKDNTLSKLGGTCSILVGVSYLVAAAVYLLSPVKVQDAAVKAALTVPGALAGLDPQAWLRFGAVGLFILVVSVLALRGNIWPKSLAYVGIGLAIAYGLVVTTNLLQIQLF